MAAVRVLGATVVAMVLAALTIPADAAVRVGETRRIGDSEFPILAAIDLSQDAWEDDSASVVVLGRVDVFPDSLAGAALAGTRGPVLFTTGGPSATLPPSVRGELARVLPPPNGCDGSGEVVMLGGTGALSPAIETELRSLGYCVTRLGGANRVETALLVAGQVLAHAGDGSRVLLASAANWPDAATGSAYAAATGHPIVMTFPEALDPSVAAFLRETAPEEIVLLGGTGALSAAVGGAAADIAPTRRVAGENRGETAVAIADELWGPRSATGVTILNGYGEKAWAYAIASAVNAALDNTPQLFVDSSGAVSVPVAELLDRTGDTFTISVGPASTVVSATELAVRSRRAIELVTTPAPLRYRDELFPQRLHREAIEYSRAPDIDGNEVTLLLDVWAPLNDRVTKRPLIVFAHGSSTYLGDRYDYYVPSKSFASRGFFVASIDYRLLPQGRCTVVTNEDGEVVDDVDEVNEGSTSELIDAEACATFRKMVAEDLETAVRYLLDHADEYGVDATRVAVWGFSAGGGAAVTAAFRVSEEPDLAIDAAISTVGRTEQEHIESIDPGDAPTLFFGGDADRMVCHCTMVQNHTAALAGGAESVLVTFEGLGHTLSPEAFQQSLDQAEAFLWHHLDLEHAAR